ncbi:MAG: hypothetical protein ACI4B5_01090 [Bacteroidaceae bacterium]
MKRTRIMLACLAIAGLTALNFTQSRASLLRNTLASSSDEDLLECTDESSSTATSSSTADNTVELSWSHAIECPTKSKDKTYYHVCQENGYENSCTTGGSVTCDCGRNCGGVGK